MAKTQSKNPCGRTRRSDNPYEVWVAGDWTWNVVKKSNSPEKEKKNPYATWTCLVVTPITGPNGEWGSVYTNSIKRSAMLKSVQDEERRVYKVMTCGDYWYLYDTDNNMISEPCHSQEELLSIWYGKRDFDWEEYELNTNTDKTFEEWMREVDRYINITIGLSSSDLADKCYRDMYDDGMAPDVVAAEVIEEEGGGMFNL